MRNLVAVHRPRRLDQIIGQPAVVETIGRYLAADSNQTLLFSGPPGTGKTTLARIIAAQVVCEKPDAPCGDCGDCQRIFAGTGTFGYTEADAGRFNEARYAKELADRISLSSVTRWVTFIDEAHCLDRNAQDALLKAAEEPHSRAIFILATSEPLGLRPALRNRCLQMHFSRLRAVDCQELLRDVCSKEAITFENRALDMLSVAANGSARQAVNLLDQVADEAAVTAELVARALAVSDLGTLIQFFEALVAGDVARQDDLLDNWAEEPLFIARQIRNFLLYLYNFDVAATRRSDIVDPAFFLVTADQRAPIVAGFRRRTDGRAFADYWLDLVDMCEVNPQTMVDLPALKIKVYRFQRALYAGDPSVPQLDGPPLSSRQRGYRSRTARRKKPNTDEGKGTLPYLDQGQVEAIYDMATFLPQEHGLLFNTSIALRHEALGIHDEVEASRFIGRLTHELSLRSRSWSSGAGAHWIYANRRGDAGLCTAIALHLPPRALDHVGPWLDERMEAWAGGAEYWGKGYDIDAASFDRAGGWLSNRVQRHWYVVRKLWGGLDPDVLAWGPDGGRMPLLDLLKARTGDREPIGVLTRLRAVGSSRSLGPEYRKRAAERRMGFLSAFRDDAWSAIFGGWELDEHASREQEKLRRQEACEKIELEYPPSTNALETRARETALDALEASWPTDPKLRLRSWKGWWS